MCVCFKLCCVHKGPRKTTDQNDATFRTGFPQENQGIGRDDVSAAGISVAFKQRRSS